MGLNGGEKIAGNRFSSVLLFRFTENENHRTLLHHGSRSQYFAASERPASSRKASVERESASSSQPAQPRVDEPRGTASAPIFVQSIPGPQSEFDSAHFQYERQEKPALDRRLTISTEFLAFFTLVLAIFTALMWVATYKLAKHAKTTGDDQSTKMAASIAEATRASAAQEGLVRATVDNAQFMQGVMRKQMRAYLIVESNGGFYQDATKRFEVKPKLSNSGFTPAIGMTYWALAAILPFPLPSGHVLPINHSPASNLMDLGPRQSLELNAVVDTRVPDNEVEDIRNGFSRRVYVWGVVSYADVFGDQHLTEFCHSIYWIGPDDAKLIGGTYEFNRNKTT
jgi:hypothetical protein